METISNKSKTIIWISYVLKGIVIIMLLMGATMNLLQTEKAVEGAMSMGYPKESVFFLGLFLLAGTLLYSFPKTTIMGALLLTAWLGGAIATHVIHKDPLFNLVLPIIFGVVIWLSIGLINDNLKLLLFKSK